jgi:hypothetical protein
MSQIVERFSAAVQALVGDGPVKNRLSVAYSEYLEDLQQVDLPIPGGSEFGELHAALHSANPVGKIDCVTASVQKMSAGEAWWHARTIVRLYTQLMSVEQNARMPVESATAEIEEYRAPPYLVRHR